MIKDLRLRPLINKSEKNPARKIIDPKVLKNTLSEENKKNISVVRVGKKQPITQGTRANMLSRWFGYNLSINYYCKRHYQTKGEAKDCPN